MRDRKEVKKSIDNILIPYTASIAWLDYGPNGNACWDPTSYDTEAEAEEAALTLAAVDLELKKNTIRHTILAQNVAAQTGNQYVTYPWLRDAVARILSNTTYDELMSMAQFSQKVRASMQAQRLTEIHSIADLFT